MKQQKTPPPSQSEWDKTPIDIHIFIALQIFLAVGIPALGEIILKFLNRVDLWLFPPLAFYSVFAATTRYFPEHPIKLIAMLATSFMAATLTLFMIRPPSKRRQEQVHWINYDK